MSWINILYKVKTSDSAPNTSPEINADLHINYWKLPWNKNRSGLKRLCFWNKKEYSRCLDIGIRLMDVDDNLEELSICLPFKFDKQRVIDLSKFFRDENFVSFVLKHRYRISTLTDCPTYFYAQKKDDDNNGKNFCIYELCEGSIKTEELSRGTMLKIIFLSHPKNLKEIREKATQEEKDDNKYNIYVRFRIEGLGDSDFCYNEDISNDFLQSAFSKTEMAEIKFNEKRTINHNDFQKITKDSSFLNFSKIDFFFSGSSDDETITGSQVIKDCELLEPEIWGDYIGDMNPMGKKCISYHWEVDPNTNKVFFRTIYSSKSFAKIAKYALVVIALSFFASLLLECCKSCTTGVIRYFNNTEMMKKDTTTNTELPNQIRTTATNKYFK